MVGIRFHLMALKQDCPAARSLPSFDHQVSQVQQTPTIGNENTKSTPRVPNTTSLRSQRKSITEAHSIRSSFCNTSQWCSSAETRTPSPLPPNHLSPSLTRNPASRTSQGDSVFVPHDQNLSSPACSKPRGAQKRSDKSPTRTRPPSPGYTAPTPWHRCEDADNNAFMGWDVHRWHADWNKGLGNVPDIVIIPHSLCLGGTTSDDRLLLSCGYSEFRTWLGAAFPPLPEISGERLEHEHTINTQVLIPQQ
ncbi:hypothetical protein QBC34DRAFT_67415, partial [Podospora aff. communis PSN243]